MASQYRKHQYSTDGVVRISYDWCVYDRCVCLQPTSAMTSKVAWNQIQAHDATGWPHHKRQCYPFQCICADYFHYQGRNYIHCPTGQGWSHRTHQRPTTHVRHMWRTLGGPEFIAHTTRQFLHTWGIPRSRSQNHQEAGNVGKDGAINIDAFRRPYFNTGTHSTLPCVGQRTYPAPGGNRIPDPWHRYVHRDRRACASSINTIRKSASMDQADKLSGTEAENKHRFIRSILYDHISIIRRHSTWDSRRPRTPADPTRTTQPTRTSTTQPTHPPFN